MAFEFKMSSLQALFWPNGLKAKIHTRNHRCMPLFYCFFPRGGSDTVDDYSRPQKLKKTSHWSLIGRIHALLTFFPHRIFFVARSRL